MYSKSAVLGNTLLLMLSSLLFSAQATIVQINTSQGKIKVNLFDKTTPETVKNFLSYVEDNSWTDSVIHRSASNFVLQGGGFSFEGAWPLTAIKSKAAVKNEPVWSNVSGTIAMAKVKNQPNSATNQWFFNLKDNSAILDVDNGGFTVFGQVVEDGMKVVTAIANLKTCYDIPMIDYTVEQCKNKFVPGVKNFVTVYSVEILNSTADSADGLTKVKNTLLTAEKPTSKSSGGSLSWLVLLSLGLVVFRRK
ncbi:MAG: peptidylprolyl isomerase [Gammaproteobacteria bacterium]|nr:peptidylprolyl isomerase [Gammaproteobacteria bacterium]